MRVAIYRWFVLVLILFFYHSFCAYGQGDTQGTWGLDKLEKLLSGKSFEVTLADLSKNPVVKWPKVYSAEFCAQRLKGKEQAESLQARKSAEMLFTQLKSYQRLLKEMPLDEFARAVNKLLDLRDSLAQPAYGNMVLQLCIERIVTFRIVERVVTRNEDLKVWETLMRRNNEWKHEWRTICQMIEEEEGKKQFDYAAMEEMPKWELYNPPSLGWDDKQQKPIENPKLLFGRYDLDKLFDREHREEMTIQGILQKRSFNGFLHFLTLEEHGGRAILPGLILFRQRGENFKDKWKGSFRKTMFDYLGRTDLVEKHLDAGYFEGMVDIAKTLAAGDEAPFMFDMSWKKTDQK